MEFQPLKRMTTTHRCIVCHAPLVLPWDGEANDYRLVCGQHREHQGYERIKSLYQEWKEGMIMPLTIANKLEKKYGGRPMATQALTTMTETQMLTRIDKAKFPQELKPEEKRLLATVAIAYGLDPLMKELTIYQGQPYVSIDGRYRKAQETNLLDGVASRPATEEERAAWSIPLCDYFFQAEVWRKGSSHPFIGWGRVRENETLGGKGFKPVETNPQRMAEKRAEAQALRKAFHIPLPSAEDIGTETATLPFDPGTGEVFEGEGKVMPASPPKPPAIAPGSPPAPPKAEARPETPLAKPKPGEAIEPNTIGAVRYWAKQKGMDEEVLAQKHGAKGVLELTEAQGQEILKELKA